MYNFYRVLHLVGVILVFLSLGGALALVANGVSKDQNEWRKRIAISHGIGLVLLLVAGFGMLARLGIGGNLPAWAWIKLLIWLLMGASLTLAYKLTKKGDLIWYSAITLGALAALLGVTKAF